MYTPYILLLLYIVVVRIICYYGDNQFKNKKNSKRFIIFAFIGIYLFSALRAYTVGYDYPAYFQVYNSIQGMSTTDVFSINFEVGYLAVMKLCSDVGLSFYGFAAVVYFIILLPLAIYIYEQSKDPFLSVMVYICYMYFEFDLTGIRQAMSISMCLLGYLVIIKNPKYWVIWYYILIAIGISFHKSAFIALIVPILIKIRDVRISAILSVFMSGVALFFRKSILTYVKDFFGKSSMNPNSKLYFGANLFFLFVLAIVFVYSAYKQQTDSIDKTSETEIRYNNSYALETKIYLLSIVVLLFFGMDNSGRAYMNLNKIIISLLPNALTVIKPRIITRSLFLIFLIVFLFMNSLIPNGFRIVPYRFFWSVF